MEKKQVMLSFGNGFAITNELFKITLVLTNIKRVLNMKPTFNLLSLSVLVGLASCGNNNENVAAEKEAQEHKRYDLALSDKLELFGKLPSTAENPENPYSASKVALGHALYYDNRLSANNTISCNSCHNLEKGGVDGLSFSPGDAGKPGGRNSPTVLNAALHSVQFWDGRAKDVEEQAGMPILNPIEMAIPSEKYLVDRLSKLPEYQQLFKSAYPTESNPITYSNIRKAIAAFERQLITPSRLDKYLAGDGLALSVQEKKGMLSFALVGCTNCHNGALLGGNSFQKFGVHRPYWELTNSATHDEGRFEQTKQESDKFIFKTPALRNVAQTSPYFHDGSVKNLEDAVTIMATLQLNYDLSNDEKKNIVAFLKSLDGEVPANFKKAPAVLASK